MGMGGWGICEIGGCVGMEKGCGRFKRRVRCAEIGVDCTSILVWILDRTEVDNLGVRWDSVMMVRRGVDVVLSFYIS